jgi:hypothetical protein
MQKFEPLRRQFTPDKVDAGHVAARNKRTVCVMRLGTGQKA